MEADGLVTHTAAGGRKVYEITDAGRAELAGAAAELAALEIGDPRVGRRPDARWPNDIEREVRGSVRDIKRELREATRDARTPRGRPWASPGPTPGSAEAPTGDPARRPIWNGRWRSWPRRSAAGQRWPGVAEPDLRAASAVVVSALTELRRLLRRGPSHRS